MPTKFFTPITLVPKEVLEKMEMLPILLPRKGSKNFYGNSMKREITLVTNTVIICDETMR